ncbi:unnamed protein product [Cercopithifilaria johnstoni]|uniref:Transmembrane protein 14C n=1 Tax=Cercopithifilaria johnstoni TaxID=2874296 RepID=A0A8J2MLS1_9BILA|nr:unnamed protein product [Cercopithifilaria johnstoni]
MNTSDLVDHLYAGVIIVGGLVGYFKAGSTMSLAAGLVFGGAAGFAAHSRNNPMLLAVSSVLALVMGSRFIQSGKIMPSGIITVLRWPWYGNPLPGTSYSLSESIDGASFCKVT